MGGAPFGQSAAHPLLTQVLQGMVLSHLTLQSRFRQREQCQHMLPTLSLRHSAQAISPLRVGEHSCEGDVAGEHAHLIRLCAFVRVRGACDDEDESEGTELGPASCSCAAGRRYGCEPDMLGDGCEKKESDGPQRI